MEQTVIVLREVLTAFTSSFALIVLLLIVAKNIKDFIEWYHKRREK